MKLITGLDAIDPPFTRTAVTIGNFDGVHLGHLALFEQTLEKAETIDGTAVAVTFEPHPIKVVKKTGHPPLITLFEQKVELISKTGIDVLICIPFNEAFSKITPRNFIKDILIDRVGMQAMVVGPDYSFGRNREGNIDVLNSFSKEYGFDLSVSRWIPTSADTSPRISSTRIRELVMAGEVEKAPALLGRYYQLRGRVVEGRNRGGKLLGFPTANIHLTDELCPKTGVYAVTVETDAGIFPGVANIGYSPTFDDCQFTVEVHLLDFKEDIYHQTIRVNMIHRLRGEIKFSGISALSEQIRNDVAETRKILAAVER
ncbi:MAG: riboflavin biosynthesis protein RibF [Deltaproteobacteria bacterium]|nr:MAG: riboflavin biosynthesis protein RibF [Deltaproteobacteria bacterium]